MVRRRRGVWRVVGRQPKMRDHIREVRVLRPSTTLALLLAAALALGGCAELVFGIAGIASGLVGIYQRYEDRQTQKDQNKKIEALTGEIKAHREKPAPAYLCLHGVTQGRTATFCQEASGHQ